MMNETFEFKKQLLSLSETVQQDKDDINEIQQDFKRLRQDFQELSLLVDRLTIELEYDRKKAKAEIELQQLRMENMLLRHERGLPPSDGSESSGLF